MATIYRFIVEGKGGRGGSGSTRKQREPKSSVGKKGKWVSALDPNKSGVEANRKMRAINPLINKMTGGLWEKGTRLGRAGMGLVQKNTETGDTRLSATAVAIIIALIINTIIKHRTKEIARINEINQNNYKSLESGNTQVRNVNNIVSNFYNGKITYNQNK